MPDNDILDITLFTYKDVPNVNGVLDSHFEEFMYASSENDGSEHPSGGSALGLDEEYSGGDDEAPTSVEIVQDNGSWDSSSPSPSPSSSPSSPSSSSSPPSGCSTSLLYFSPI